MGRCRSTDITPRSVEGTQIRVRRLTSPRSLAWATSSGEDASARSIRAKLEKMVADESPAKPLTDQQIVHLFQEQGIKIARRTVAKYRDQLGILPARMRKRV